MKTEQFKKGVEELGFEVLEYDRSYEFGEAVPKRLGIFTKESGSIVANVHLINQYEIQIYQTSSTSGELYNLITEYSKTPTEERL